MTLKLSGGHQQCRSSTSRLLIICSSHVFLTPLPIYISPQVVYCTVPCPLEPVYAYSMRPLGAAVHDITGRMNSSGTLCLRVPPVYIGGGIK